MNTNLRFLRIISFILIIFFLSCENRKSKNNDTNFNTVKNFYAKCFKIEKNNAVTKLSIFDTEGILKNEYYLIDTEKEIPQNIKNKSIIRVPVKKVICLSTTHIAFLDILDETDKIIAVSGTQYVYSQILRKRIQKDEIKDVGYENSLDFELLLSLKPDLVTVYDINGSISPAINKLKQYHIPVVQINEYLEPSVLGQAEWLKFFAEFFNKSEFAKNKFAAVCKSYSELKKMTDTVTEKPTVLLNMPWKGTWYIPGGKSNVAQLIADAGGNYIWKNTEEQHNTALSIEEVYSEARQADFWLNPGQAKSINDIIGTDIRLKKFSALKTGEVFNRNNRLSPSGGNDYMESGTVRPDLILKDLIQILHPELIRNDSLFFYQKLK
ncbi:MAG: ABC transporter substrate-binding protein [Chlorobi bacterium]|nr:ABC transporter substrate-binding protein [Chlorobiota bacterium]